LRREVGIGAYAQMPGEGILRIVSANVLAGAPLDNLPDLSFTETAYGVKVINAAGEDVFWKYGASHP
jgi:hypothetical protein